MTPAWREMENPIQWEYLNEYLLTLACKWWDTPIALLVDQAENV